MQPLQRFNQKRHQHTYMKKIILSIVIAATAFSASQAATRSKKSDIAANVTIFSSIIKQLQTNYVDSIDMESVMKTGIDAMLYKLDPYTEYFDTQEQQDFRDQNAGEYAGIGSYIMKQGDYVVITGPHKGSPADRAGLRQGDKIISIDGLDMKGKNTDQVSEKLKGAIGSTVSVKVNRPWVTDSILTITVTRDKIQIPAVPYYGVVSGDLGYIQLSQYSEKSADEVKTALLDLINNHHIKGLILDLRGNVGGFLESAVRILSYFLPKGTEVLRTRGKNVTDEKIYKTSSRPIAPTLPLVVLTDGGTASAAEITAGALQDLDRAVVIGTRTFGKGLVQSTFSLPYDGMMKITTAKYYIPSGRLIQAINYADRDENGAVKRIADSLTNEFTTAAGRIVRDGGGITPDIEMSYPDVNRITYNVVTDNWAFDFANKYFAEHPDTPALDDIVITDSIYADFKRFIDPTRFNYDKVCETALDALRKLAESEGYMSPEVDAQISVLDGLMKHSLDKDLDINREAIAGYLEQEIAERYYYDEGSATLTLRHDKMFDRAVEVLDNSAEYKKLLLPKPTAGK